jgi:hypothetical protein
MHRRASNTYTHYHAGHGHQRNHTHTSVVSARPWALPQVGAAAMPGLAARSCAPGGTPSAPSAGGHLSGLRAPSLGRPQPPSGPGSPTPARSTRRRSRRACARPSPPPRRLLGQHGCAGWAVKSAELRERAFLTAERGGRVRVGSPPCCPSASAAPSQAEMARCSRNCTRLWRC